MSILSCPICKSEFEARGNKKYCGAVCRLAARPTIECADCGGPIIIGRSVKPEGQARCFPCRRVHGSAGMYKNGCRCEACMAYSSKRHRDYAEEFRAVHGVGPKTAHRKRVKESKGFWPQRGSKDWIEPLVRLSLYERDSWSCHLCGEAVNRDAHFNDDDAPSLDHLLPRSQGGTHEHSNLKTAHRLCNSTRRDALLTS